MNISSRSFGRFWYATTFLIIIPLILWLWARYTSQIVTIPAVQSTIAGLILMAFGVLLMLWAMYSLKVYGKGLPMNYDPPPVYVAKGPYKIMRHPIYWGFAFAMVGYFILTGSSSGLWLVTPVTILAMIALVWGYEQIDLHHRFPDVKMKSTFDLPEKHENLIGAREPWIATLWLIVALILGAYITNWWSESSILIVKVKVPEEWGLLLVMVLNLVVPFLIRKKARLRRWTISSLLLVSLSVYCFLLLGLPFNRYLIIFSISLMSIWNLWGRSKVLAIIWGMAMLVPIVYSFETQSVLNLQLPIFLLILLVSNYYGSVWRMLRNTSEKIANSWQERVFGKIRFINHGNYVGMGAFLGIGMAGLLAGEYYAWGILVFSVVVVLFSALWAQIIEGSEKLKRPFGYYGALVGILFASMVVWLMGLNVWLIIGVISVVMPWVQAMGRLRCLVNGCCHGDKTDNPDLGIRYHHHRSRVCGISGLKGELLHPTQLYAIIWLFFIGFILLALWNNSFPASFIFGMYLILTGIGRFVEEAYRGEVQTPVFGTLRLYQWTAILSVMVGMVMTIMRVDVPTVEQGFGWEIVLSALIGGLFTFFAMGVDFPYSNARFSRLV